MLGPGCIFLESDMLEGMSAADPGVSTNFLAMQDSELLFVAKRDFQRLMKNDMEVANFAALSIAKKMHALRAQLYEGRHHAVLWRTASLFAEFARQHGVQKGDRIMIDFNITQQFVANMLGTNRITVAKSVKRLKELGLIEKTDDYYYICDHAKMNEFLETFQ